MVRLELALADDTAFGLMHQGAALQGDELTLHASGIANGATLLLTGGASEHDATRAELEALDSRVKGLGDMIRGELINQFEDELGEIRTKLDQKPADEPPDGPGGVVLAGPLEEDSDEEEAGRFPPMPAQPAATLQAPPPSLTEPSAAVVVAASDKLAIALSQIEKTMSGLEQRMGTSRRAASTCQHRSPCRRRRRHCHCRRQSRLLPQHWSRQRRRHRSRLRPRFRRRLCRRQPRPRLLPWCRRPRR